MKFVPGKSGNPRGRRRGIRNKATGIRELLEKHAPAVLEVVVALARKGDLTACKLVLDRVCPVVRPIEFPTPPPPAQRKEDIARRIDEIFGIVRRPSMPVPARPAKATPASAPNPDGTAPAPTVNGAQASADDVTTSANQIDHEAIAAMGDGPPASPPPPSSAAPQAAPPASNGGSHGSIEAAFAERRRRIRGE